MKGRIRLTKLQAEFVDENTTKDSYVAFPLSIFKSWQYKKWKQNRRNLATKFK